MFWKKKKKTEKTAPVLSAPAALRSFAEGAARFAAIARSAHGHPLDNATVCTDADHCSALISPDEIWARQFMTQGIGPLSEGHAMAKAPPMQSSFTMQSFALGNSGEVQTKTNAQHPVEHRTVAEKSGPMGAQIGRPSRR